MKSKFALAFVLVVSGAQSSFAQFGGVVYDPTNYHNAVLRYLQSCSSSLRLARSKTWWPGIVPFLPSGRI